MREENKFRKQILSDKQKTFSQQKMEELKLKHKIQKRKERNIVLKQLHWHCLLREFKSIASSIKNKFVNYYFY